MAAKKTATKKSTTSITKASANTDSATVVNPTVPELVETDEAKSAKIKMVVDCAPHPALNVRKEPHSTAAIVGELRDGTKIDCADAVDGWYAVDDGFVNADFLVRPQI